MTFCAAASARLGPSSRVLGWPPRCGEDRPPCRDAWGQRPCAVCFCGRFVERRMAKSTGTGVSSRIGASAAAAPCRRRCCTWANSTTRNRPGVAEPLRQPPSSRRPNWRCLDQVLAHKADLFSHLKAQWADWFGATFEVLLYDLTSTYVECAPPGGEDALRRHGYSRDKRPDGVQVVIALMVTPEGLPLASRRTSSCRSSPTVSW